MSGRERARILHKAAGLVRASAEAIVRLDSPDAGKPVSLCLPADVLTTAEQYEHYPALAQPVDGATRQIPVNAHAYTRREPLGVQRSLCLLRRVGIGSLRRRVTATGAGRRRGVWRAGCGSGRRRARYRHGGR